MKLLGLSCGKKMGNSEVLLKEALMGAEHPKIDAEIIRLIDLNIQSCRFCKVCLRNEGKPEDCIVKDDVPFMIEKFMEADGLIISAPVYILAPPGLLKLLADRMLADLAGEIDKKKAGVNKRTGKKIEVDDRTFKRRVGAFICQGGATTPHWVSLGLPMMHCNTFPRQIDLVDQMNILGAGSIAFRKDVFPRARKLGKNVADAMLKLEGKSWSLDTLGNIGIQYVDQPEWKGDEMGTCPVCHSSLLTVGKENPVECAICGSKGELKVVGKKITVDFSQAERDISRLTIEGKRIHQEEIFGNMVSMMERREESDKAFAKYKDYGKIVAPPKKKVAK